MNSYKGKNSVFILFSGKENKKEKKKGVKSIKCSFCGYTYSDFKEIGFLGCPECYNKFSSNIIKYLRSIHRNIKHKGKIPIRYKNEKS